MDQTAISAGYSGLRRASGYAAATRSYGTEVKAPERLSVNVEAETERAAREVFPVFPHRPACAERKPGEVSKLYFALQGGRSE